MTPATKSALWIIGILVIIIAVSAYFMRDTDNVDNENANSSDQVVCTMDAKMCPDGSYVGRVAPNCQFAACPSATSTSGNGGTYYPADILK
ncbi:MAG: hypothetical protein Q8L64_03695 [bacterium]|nr:hypothetical protein [bacterium]